MACCLTTPNHYLNQYIDLSSMRSSGVLARAIPNDLLKNQINEVNLEIDLSKLSPFLPAANELTKLIVESVLKDLNGCVGLFLPKASW